jgi:phenylalanine-4-hydroxylase
MLPPIATPARAEGVSRKEAALASKSEWIVDQGWEGYTPAQHAVWDMLCRRQQVLLAGRACDEFLTGLQALPIGTGGIPDFRRLNEALAKATGWQVVPVAGLVPDEVFFELLATRRFPAGNFIRQPAQLDYLQEPDVFHDVFGHVPMLMHPVFADYMQAYGQGGLRARGLGRLAELARVYWYTVEFGLVRQGRGLRIYGSGIASSAAESVFSLEDDSPNRVAFDLERVMSTAYRIDDFQQTYFVIGGMDALLHLARVDFAPVYDRVAGRPTIDPGEVLPTDTLLHRGTGRHHRSVRPRQA